MNKEWSELNKAMQTLIAFKEELCRADFDAIPYINTEGYHSKTLACNLGRPLQEAEQMNFPSNDVYDRCVKTIGNNKFETNEITAAGLTVERAVKVNAPRIKEFFLISVDYKISVILTVSNTYIDAGGYAHE